MKKHIGLIIISMLLMCAITVNLTGCAAEVKATNLMSGIVSYNTNVLDDLRPYNVSATDFAIRLFKACEQNGKNTLISPLSALYALAMTANGAEDETLTQMEAVLGMTVEDFNLYLYSYMQGLPRGDKYKLSLANSIWLNDGMGFIPNRAFLQTNADYYGADIYEIPFNNQALKKINNLVKEKTDGMITDMLDYISPDAVMYLVNALAFEAEWADVYEESQVKKAEFTKEDGTKQNVELMHSTVSTYFEDEKATGFLRYYNGNKYAFVAMLPNEGISVSEYVATLDGATLNALLSNPKHLTVNTAIPKFETEYGLEMSDILKAMGMTNAFDGNLANYGNLGMSSSGESLYINRVLHKTFISVDEKGTKAGAATVVEINELCEIIDQGEDVKTVILDRPFVYMLIDCENNIPFFIGTMLDVN